MRRLRDERHELSVACKWQTHDQAMKSFHASEQNNAAAMISEAASLPVSGARSCEDRVCCDHDSVEWRAGILSQRISRLGSWLAGGIFHSR